MEALLVEKIPEGRDWLYEPKWDGFRCLVFRDHDAVEFQSKSGQPLARYFPEVVDDVRLIAATRFVLDCEVVIPVGDALSFEELLMRIHPAESRIRKLARERPALLIAFDLLEEQGRLLTLAPLRDRRQALERFFSRSLGTAGRIRLSPTTSDSRVARDWLQSPNSSLDGIVAKRADLPYQSGERTGMQKVKLIRSADCVVGGFRYGTGSKLVGSLLLGLYDHDGRLNHVGFTSGIQSKAKPQLTGELEAMIKPPGFTGRAPGGPSRWSTERSAEWQPVEPRLVVEVAYNHFSGGRFRHGTKLLRWRPDKHPHQCLMGQVEMSNAAALDLLESRTERGPAR